MVWVIAIFAAWLGLVFGTWYLSQYIEHQKNARRRRLGLWVAGK